MDELPELNFYEITIIKTSKFCNSVTDIINYGKIIGIKDIEEFIDLVLLAKGVRNA